MVIKNANRCTINITVLFMKEMLEMGVDNIVGNVMNILFCGTDD